MARRNVEDIIERVRRLGAASIENSSVSLRELFLAAVKEETHNALV